VRLLVPRTVKQVALKVLICWPGKGEIEKMTLPPLVRSLHILFNYELRRGEDRQGNARFALADGLQRRAYDACLEKSRLGRSRSPMRSGIHLQSEGQSEISVAHRNWSKTIEGTVRKVLSYKNILAIFGLLHTSRSLGSCSKTSHSRRAVAHPDHWIDPDRPHGWNEKHSAKVQRNAI
jgi:hypothetical protein